MTKKISLEFAQKLCSDFELVQRKDLGKPACMHLMGDGEMCRRGDHFLCELKLYKMRAEAKEDREKREAVSASRVWLLNKCARKYHIERELYLKVDDPIFFKVGDAFSVARARMDRGLPFNLTDIRSDIPNGPDRAKLRAVLRLYADNPPEYPTEEVTCEDQCQFNFEGTWFIGYSDVLTSDGDVIIDWKYAKDRYTRLQVAQQAAVYLKGFPSASRFEIWRMPKPSHRPKKSGESMLEFEQRIYEDWIKKGVTHDRLTIERESIDVDGTLRMMKGTFEKHLTTMHQLGMPPNYAKECGLCSIEPYCSRMLGQPTNAIVRELHASGVKKK